MQTQMTPEIIEHFLTELEHPSRTLTSWELEFLTSIRDQFDRRGTLTERQFNKLESIYAEKTE